jgi:hypothetical protein
VLVGSSRATRRAALRGTLGVDNSNRGGVGASARVLGTVVTLDPDPLTLLGGVGLALGAPSQEGLRG